MPQQPEPALLCQLTQSGDLQASTAEPSNYRAAFSTNHPPLFTSECFYFNVVIQVCFVLVCYDIIWCYYVTTTINPLAQREWSQPLSPISSISACLGHDAGLVSELDCRL